MLEQSRDLLLDARDEATTYERAWQNAWRGELVGNPFAAPRFLVDAGAAQELFAGLGNRATISDQQVAAISELTYNASTDHLMATTGIACNGEAMTRVRTRFPHPP